MKRICLAVMFSLIICGQAKADLHGDFLRIECNQDLGLLELRSEYISGDRMGIYFDKLKPFYKYSIDTNGEDKSHAEIILVNYLGNEELPFTYRCQLSKNQIYDVYIDLYPNSDCNAPNSSATFAINIVENIGNKKILIDNFPLGCASPVDGIQLTVSDDLETADMTFLFDSPIAFYLGGDIDKPISLEMVKREKDIMMAPIGKK